jgi:2-oxoglutarate dehydrogenase E2 component (dihydrolipoamide succinyltransferase)
MPNIVVPTLGESVVEARVSRWLKQEGDPVSVGDALVSLETEKVDVEVSADASGVLASITRREGEDVQIGEVLGTIDEGVAGATPPQPVKAGGAGGTETPRSTPTAKRVAESNSVDLGSVTGTGAAGRIHKTDVEAALAPAAAKPAPTAPPAPPASPASPARRPADTRGEKRVRMSKRRATIARRLVEAQRTAAMLTTFNEVDMSAVMTLRERHKVTFRTQHGVGLGIASFFVKGATTALRAFPQLNAEIQGDEIVYKPFYDIGIAVGAEGGLVVPVLRNAEALSFSAIETGIRDFAKRAQDGSLTLEDLAGGTFTITNGGVFGSLLSTPILNPPQVAILGLHKIQDRPVAVHGQVSVRPMMYIALSYDHRIVDGREAVQFLVKIKELVEDPGQLLLES